MRFEIAKSEVAITPAIKEAIEHKVAKVNERLKRIHPDAAEMELRVEFNDREKTHECSLHLRAFKDALHAKKTAPELRVAVDKTFDALMAELENYRSKINPNV